MDIQLNFLQFQPIKNWLDYFVHRQDLHDLLDAAQDLNIIINLCDQFTEQAIATEKELSQLENKLLDQEDIICMRHKADDLWICAIACFAACDWDLKLLIKNSNVIRNQALLDRLTQWIYETEEQHFLLDDTFSFIFLNFTSTTFKFTPLNIFVAWLYARWILLIDLELRFPTIPAKPTVSNPYYYVDQSLIQAEKLAQAAMDIQHKMRDAVTLLKYILEQEEKFCSNGVHVPKKKCFYPRLDVITKESPISVLTHFPRPVFKNGKWILDWKVFQMRITFDLLVANFTASHFEAAKQITGKLRENMKDFDKNLADENSLLFIPDRNEVAAYANAFALQNNEQTFPNRTTLLSNDSNPLLQFALQKPKHHIPADIIVKMLVNGNCRIPKVYLEKELMQSEEQRHDLIQNFYVKLSLLSKSKSPFDSIYRARLTGSLYFLCSHCYGFANSLSKHTQLIAEHGLKIRNSAIPTCIDIPQKPTEEQLQVYSTSDNALWNVITSFDIKLLRNSFGRVEFYKFNTKKMVFSPVSADLILDAISNSGDRFFVRNQLMLWKLEQLARLGNVEKWKEFLNNFSEDCNVITGKPELNLGSILLFDLMRVELTNWNLNFYRPSDPSEFLRHTPKLRESLIGTLDQAMKTKLNTFQVFSKELACFLLNNCDWKTILGSIKNQSLFVTPFTQIAIIFAFYFNKLQIEKKHDEAFKTAREIIWKVLTPTFDSQKLGQEPRQGVIGKDELIELLEGIKEREVLNMFIGLVSFLYNFALTTDQKPLDATITGSLDVSSLSAVAAAMDTSILPEDTSAHQHHNAGVNLLRNIGRNIYLDNIELWQAIKMEDYRTYDVDIAYIEKILDLLSQQARLVGPIYIPWLRFRADYAFVRGNYADSAKLYLETIMAMDRGVLGMPTSISDEDAAIELAKQMDKLTKQMDIHTIYGKLATCLYFIRMPTLAAIIGQMRSNIKSHLSMVEFLLMNTPVTVDSGPAYFPLVADIQLMEKMAVVYESLDLPLYSQELLKSMPTRAINLYNSSEVLKRECKRRKKRFMEILCKQFFNENLGRK